VDFLSKNRILIALVIFLVILNIACLSFVLFSPFRGGMPPPGGERGNDPIQGFIERELNLTDQQRMEHRTVREQFFRHGDELRLERTGAMKELFELIRKDSVSEEEVRRVTSKTGEVETLRSRALYNHFRRIRQLCTPEQRKKFDAIITDVMKQVEPPMGEPGPPKR
jgi:periplasmic protein CpxP/Spy